MLFLLRVNLDMYRVQWVNRLLVFPVGRLDNYKFGGCCLNSHLVFAKVFLDSHLFLLVLYE